MSRAGMTAREQRVAVQALINRANSISAALKSASASGTEELCDALTDASESLGELAEQCEELIERLGDEITAVDVEIAAPKPPAVVIRCSRCKALGYAAARCERAGHLQGRVSSAR
jgi:HPt (histidine-containing phosphotransfer) domain-containing protein